MWADAQRDGRPAEYSPLFNAAKFGWRPYCMECRAVTLPRRETRWNSAGVPQTNETISAASKPKFTIFWEHVEEILLPNKFFSIVGMCFNCEDIARQICAMVPWWRFFWRVFASCISASGVQHVSVHLKFALRPHHVWKYGRHPICDGWDEAMK